MVALNDNVHHADLSILELQQRVSRIGF